MWTRYNDHLQIIPFPLKGKQCVILQHSDQPSLLNSRLQSEIAYTGLEKQRKKLKRSLIALTLSPQSKNHQWQEREHRWGAWILYNSVKRMYLHAQVL
jgi:hypothetical protein